jgi:hypothetical protein
MSYRRPALGQAKWIPGQISFATTRTGRIPSLQPLIEAGLPLAPYVEHGSWARGTPDIMRYGRDPYRGIMGLGTDPTEVVNQAIRSSADSVRGSIHEAATAIAPAALIATGAVAGGVAGAVSGFFGKSLLGGILGAVGGGAVGYGASRLLQSLAERTA